MPGGQMVYGLWLTRSEVGFHNVVLAPKAQRLLAELSVLAGELIPVGAST